MVRTGFLLLTILISSALGPSAALAQSLIDGILIQAETTEGYTEKDQFLLKGDVQVAFQGQSIKCDQALVDIRNSTVEAVGNVVLDDARIHLEADRIKINYKTNTGEIENGYIQSGQVIVEGKKIKKTGDQTYVAEEAEFTSCATCPPGWSFSGKVIEAEMGGYAKIKRPVFKMGGWSVLPLPWLMVPLKTERQSGLLVPSYEYSQRGKFAIAQPFFWAISPSQDATLSVAYHELLGLKYTGEYRYVLSEKSKGDLYASFIEDRLFPSDLKQRYAGVESARTGRWHIKYNHHYALPDGYVQRVDFVDISDLDYLKDFPNETRLMDISPGDPALENRVSITKNTNDLHLSAEAMFFKNLQRAYALGENSDSVHKMPELQFRSSEMSLWDYGPSVSFDVNSTHFVRDQFSYDDLQLVGGERVPIDAGAGRPGEYQRSGTFDPATDLLRTGHRLDLSTRAQYPFQIAQRFEINPSVTFREMQYQFQIPDETSTFAPSAAQRYLQTDLTASTEFSAVYGEEGRFNERYKHSFVPQVSYSHIPWIRRPHHPFFGQFEGQRFNRSLEPISDQDLNGINKIQFDYDDRVFDRDFVTLALKNQWTKKAFADGQAVYGRLAYFELNQSYDINESRTDRPQPWSNVQGILGLDLENLYVDSVSSYNPYANFTNTSTRILIKPETNHYFQISYSRSTLVDEDNRIQPDSDSENVGLGLGMVSTYWDLTAQLDYSRISREIQAWQYISRIKPPGNCWYIELFHRQELGGDTSLKANVSFNFGGEDNLVSSNPPPTTSTQF